MVIKVYYYQNLSLKFWLLIRNKIWLARINIFLTKVFYQTFYLKAAFRLLHFFFSKLLETSVRQANFAIQLATHAICSWNDGEKRTLHFGGKGKH